MRSSHIAFWKTRPCRPPKGVDLPPLEGGERPGRTAVDHNEGGSFEEIALDAPEQCIEQDRLLAITLKHQASSVHGPIEG